MQTISFEKIWQLFLFDPKSPLVFNSGLFLILFFFFLIFYIQFEKKHLSKIIYVSAFSLFFYYKCSGIYFLILLVSTIVDYYLSHFIYTAKTKRNKTILLVISLIVNLGMLAYFKYTNFIIDIVNGVAHNNIAPLDIILPVGISFYTFQSLSYTIDVYRDEIKPLNNFLDFYFCISFFPHLVAGPIMRASFIIPQLYKDYFLSKSQVARAFYLIMAGLIKKAVISDYISLNFVDRVFDNPLLYSSFENIMAAYGYALQIYCDFSGYSDIAIGVALLIGFNLPINFNSPYKASSVTDFWRRWHISLSTWLRDYLYIPLGGNRKGKFRQYGNLFTTMLIGGLWHGASWKFVFWGAMHGLALAFEKFFTSIIKYKRNIITKVIGIIITFHFITFCWIFFRASSFTVATDMLKQIALFSYNYQLIYDIVIAYKVIFIMIAIGYIIHYVPSTVKSAFQNMFAHTPILVKSIMLTFVIWIVVQAKSADIQPFIYFQF